MDELQVAANIWYLGIVNYVLAWVTALYRVIRVGLETGI